MKTTILLADDHAVFRHGLASLLRERDGWEVVAEAADGEEAVRLAGTLRPRTAMIDVKMTRLAGIEAAQRIRKVSPETRIVVLSMYADARYQERAREAGATLYIAVTAHPKLDEALKESARIADYLRGMGAVVANLPLYDESLHQRVQSGEFDLLIAIGGDGTMLRAGHLCGPSQVPILGINQSRFGFLMEIRANQWRDVVPRLLAR